VLDEPRNRPSDSVRDAALVRELAASVERTRLTCDFIVFGGIWRGRAIRLLEKPRLITARMRAPALSARSLSGSLTAWTRQRQASIPRAKADFPPECRGAQPGDHGHEREGDVLSRPATQDEKDGGSRQIEGCADTRLRCER
jgi:hypothetical protein